MTKPTAKRLSLLTGLCAAAVAGAVLAAAGETVAYPDAKVETQLRPDFGLLLKPPIKRHRRYKPWGGRRYPPAYYDGPGYGPPGGPGRDVAFVDCAQARDDNAVNRALASLKPGGTLILRAAGAACLDSVVIDKPVTIQGDGGAPLRGWRLGWNESQRRSRTEILEKIENAPVTFRSRPGSPCMVIDLQPGLRGQVVLRDLVIEQKKAGDEACIYAHNSDLRIESSVIVYAGEGSAIYLDGGSLTTSDSVEIDADTWGQAIYVDGGYVDLDDTTVYQGAIGLQLEPGGDKGSRIRHSKFVTWPRQSATFGTASAGVVIPGGRQGQQLIIEDTRICGYGIGLWVEGSSTVEVNKSLICRVGKGVYAAGGRVTLRGNTVRASNIGVQVGAGQVVLGDNQFHGIRYVEIYREPGAPPIEAAGNQFYSGASQFCSWRRVDDGYWGRGHKRPSWHKRYGGMYYAPGSSNGYGECMEPQGSSYPDEAGYGYEDGGQAFYAPTDTYDGHAWPDAGNRVWGPYDHYDGDREDYYLGGKASADCGDAGDMPRDKWRKVCPPRPPSY